MQVSAGTRLVCKLETLEFRELRNCRPHCGSHGAILCDYAKCHQTLDTVGGWPINWLNLLVADSGWQDCRFDRLSNIAQWQALAESVARRSVEGSGHGMHTVHRNPLGSSGHLNEIGIFNEAAFWLNVIELQFEWPKGRPNKEHSWKEELRQIPLSRTLRSLGLSAHWSRKPEKFSPSSAWVSFEQSLRRICSANSDA